MFQQKVRRVGVLVLLCFALSILPTTAADALPLPGDRARMSGEAPSDGGFLQAFWSYLLSLVGIGDDEAPAQVTDSLENPAENLPPSGGTTQSESGDGDAGPGIDPIGGP